MRAAAADKALRSEKVLLQPVGQTTMATAPGKVKASKAAGKVGKKGRQGGAASSGGGCCCCWRSSEVFE